MIFPDLLRASEKVTMAAPLESNPLPDCQLPALSVGSTSLRQEKGIREGALIVVSIEKCVGKGSSSVRVPRSSCISSSLAQSN